jgi:hypothetical protein
MTRRNLCISCAERGITNCYTTQGQTQFVANICDDDGPMCYRCYASMCSLAPCITPRQELRVNYYNSLSIDYDPNDYRILCRRCTTNSRLERRIANLGLSSEERLCRKSPAEAREARRAGIADMIRLTRMDNYDNYGELYTDSDAERDAIEIENTMDPDFDSDAEYEPEAMPARASGGKHACRGCMDIGCINRLMELNYVEDDPAVDLALCGDEGPFCRVCQMGLCCNCKSDPKNAFVDSLCTSCGYAESLAHRYRNAISL